MAGRARIIVINLFTAAAFLILLEIAARIVLKKIYNREFDSSLIVDNKYFNSSGLKENAKGEVWGKHFNTDEYACRKNAIPYNSRKKKWLFIGDSVTEGVGEDDSNTFSSLVNSRNDSFNIYNYSLIGYSDADYLNVLRVKLGRGDEGIKRVTIFFCLNDVYASSGTSQLPGMTRQDWKGKMNALLQKSYATYKLLKLIFYQNSDRYFQYDLQFYDSQNKHFLEAMNTLGQCDLLCKNQNIELDVIMLPYRSQLVRDSEGSHIPQQLVANFCLSNRINFLDASGALSCENPAPLYLFADEIHFSKLGHQAIANFILSH